MTTLDPIRPVDALEVEAAVRDAARDRCVLEARSGGSKREIGAPSRETRLLNLSAFVGIVDYEPSELVLTVRPGTPLSEVEALLAAHGQMLAFEPWDHGPLFGRSAGAATIGGVVAAGVAGPRRVSAGGPRDHLLGFEAVSGRGEIFRAGGKVVKNVTGYDVSKVIAGSWGQLAIMTELTLKVVPCPRAVTTVALGKQGPAAAIAAMAKAMGSRCAVSAAAHVPEGACDVPLTAIRLEGFRESVDVRARQLCDELAPFGAATILPADFATSLWSHVGTGAGLAGSETLWRTHHASSRTEAFVAAVERMEGKWHLDWAGACAWVGAPAGADVRHAAEAHEGHAMLVHAPAAIRASAPARTFGSDGISALTGRLKVAFDPVGILDPLRFG